MEFRVKIRVIVMIAGFVDFMHQNHGMMLHLELPGSPKPVIPVLRPHVGDPLVWHPGFDWREKTYFFSHLSGVQHGGRADDVADGHYFWAEFNGQVAVGQFAPPVQVPVPDGIAVGQTNIRVLLHETDHFLHEIDLVHIITVQVSDVPAHGRGAGPRFAGCPPGLFPDELGDGFCPA